MRDYLLRNNKNEINLAIFSCICSTLSSLMHLKEAKTQVLAIGANDFIHIIIALSKVDWKGLNRKNRPKLVLKCIKILRLLTDELPNVEILNRNYTELLLDVMD